MDERVIATVNLAAIERNVAELRARARPAELCAVVKADGYGHGAVETARAAQAAGAVRLAVATATEATRLRAAGVHGPVLVLGALTPKELRTAVAARADVVVWRPDMVARVAELGDRPVGVHVKYDTGMGRLGTRDPEQGLRTVHAALDTAGVTLAGAMTHFATADEDDDFFDVQLTRFTQWIERVRELAPDVVVHAANSAATLRAPDARFDLVRTGVAIYGLDPYGIDPAAHGLEPALALRSYVAEIKRARPQDSVGYGRTYVTAGETDFATVPIGYGDGWRRRISEAATVLVGGHALPIAGRVSMDSLSLELGLQHGLTRDQEVVLIGKQAGARVLAEDVARWAGTINYEITCGLTSRVPRVYHRDGTPEPAAIR